MNKIIITFLVIFCWSNTLAQGLEDDNQSLEKYIGNLDSSSLLIIYSDNDCFKCSLPLYNIANILKSIPRYQNDDLKIKTITNNYSLASKYLKESKLKSEIIFDKSLPTRTGSCLAFRLKNRIKILPIDQISRDSLLQYLNYTAATQDFIISDSLLSFNNFIVGSTYFGIALFDAKMQLGILTDLKNYQYATPTFKDTTKINSLKTRIKSNEFKKLPFINGYQILKENGINFLHINSLASLDSIIYLTFSINKCYQSVKDTADYGIFTSYYLAKKKLHSENDFESIFNIDSYQNIYFIDTFSFNNKTYPIGNWIDQQPIVKNIDIIEMIVNCYDPETKIYKFGGLATIDISDEVDAKMFAIDTLAKPEIIISHLFNYRGKPMGVSKTIINEERSLGNIEFKEITKHTID